MPIRLHRPRIRMLLPCSLLALLTILAAFAAFRLQSWLLAAISPAAAGVALVVYLEWVNLWIEVLICEKVQTITGLKMHIGSIAPQTSVVKIGPIVRVDIAQPWYWRLANCADLTLYCADGQQLQLGLWEPSAFLVADVIEHGPSMSAAAGERSPAHW